MTQIVNPYLSLLLVRKTGYKTATALAELVDNSIEANAKDIDIIAKSESVLVNRTSSKQVTKIAVLDNGDGMTEDILGKCLSLGWGTRIDAKEEELKLGKFGFGLKGSSISQARRIEVYSWQNVDWSTEDINQTKINMACLDLDKIKENQQEELDPVIKDKFPDIVKMFGYKIKKHSSGTLVVWSNLDRLKFKRIDTLVRMLNKDLCRIYRHYLIDSKDFGASRNINIQDIGSKAEGTKTTTLVPNDPLYLMTPNNLKDHENEATNVVFEKFSEELSYENSLGQESKSKVEFIITIAMPEIQKLGGNSGVGVHYQDNCGISFVRAGREIDFGTFGFLDNSEPRHRWWGIEIRFKPELDDLLGVTNSKQSIHGIKALDKAMKKDLLYEKEHSFEDEMIVKMNTIISDQITNLMKVIKGRGERSRTPNEPTNAVVDRVNKELDKQKNIETESKEHGIDLTDAEKIQEKVSFLVKDDASLSEKDAKEIAKKTINYQVDLMTDEWPGNLFLERKAAGSTSIGRINRNTAFYEKFYKKLEDSPDKSGHDALSIILMSLIRAEDELQVLMDDKKALSRFRQKWSDNIDNLLDKAAD